MAGGSWIELARAAAPAPLPTPNPPHPCKSTPALLPAPLANSAAIHAGVLTNMGGTITIFYERGRVLYLGSKKNGVESQDWGTYDSSFKFAPPALPPTATCKDTANYGNIVSPTRRSLRLVCPGGCLADRGSLYGTGEPQGCAGTCCATSLQRCCAARDEPELCTSMLQPRALRFPDLL